MWCSVTPGTFCEHWLWKLIITSPMVPSLHKIPHASVRREAWGRTPWWWKQSFFLFLFPALQGRTKTSTVIWIDFQWLKDPLWFSLLSSKSNTFWACKVVQPSWTAESMLSIKSHSQPKPRESISSAMLATQLGILRLIWIRVGTKCKASIDGRVWGWLTFTWDRK